MKKIFVGVAAIALTIGSFSCGNKKSELKTQEDSIAYAIGLMQGSRYEQMFEQAKQAEQEVNQENFLKGLKDGLANPEKADYFRAASEAAGMAKFFSEKAVDINLDIILDAINVAVKKDSVNRIEMSDSLQQALLQAFQTKMQEAEMKKAEEELKANKEKGAKFIEEFKKEEGVQTTESGLAYKVLTAGTGEMPTAEDKVKVNYKGTLIDGTEFDANDGIEFGVTQVIPGWTEMLQLMKVGDKVKVVIPSDIAYGDRQAGPSIKAGSTLVFEMELLEVIKAEKTEKAEDKK